LLTKHYYYGSQAAQKDVATVGSALLKRSLDSAAASCSSVSKPTHPLHWVEFFFSCQSFFKIISEVSGSYLVLIVGINNYNIKLGKMDSNVHSVPSFIFRVSHMILLQPTCIFISDCSSYHHPYPSQS
jgi:hypothetical protein